MNICRVCNNEIKFAFKRNILNKYSIHFFHCKNCGFIQTEPAFWLDEAYSDAINDFDTGILARNISFSKIASILLIIYFSKNAQFLDYGGGYGIFTRLMRDLGFNFYTFDPQCQNIIARGYEFDPGNTHISAITAWECFEHFEDPLKDIGKMLKISKNILFSTELLPEQIPDPNTWRYYGFEHGQHISFYSRETLDFIAKKFNLHIYSGKNIHFLSERRINPRIFSILQYLPYIGIHKIFYLTMKTKTQSDMENKITAFYKR